MHLAIMEKRYDLLDVLKDFRADPRIKNKENLTPIDLAFSMGDKDLLNFFRKVAEYARYL
jgi:ankyrin repeat protein